MWLTGRMFDVEILASRNFANLATVQVLQTQIVHVCLPLSDNYDAYTVRKPLTLIIKQIETRVKQLEGNFLIVA